MSSWADLLSGGLPQLIMGPAGKAISRLIGAAVEFPAAWLDQKTQQTRDETEARSAVMKALAHASAQVGATDSELLSRGLNNLLGKAYREQENKEAVAQKTIEHLSTEPASSGNDGPSDDWMNVFEAYAAKASSEELRETWAKVLAGEIRKPHTFSLSTLQFIALLDKDVAEATEELISRVFEGRYLYISEGAAGRTLEKLNLTRSLGIIQQLDPDIQLTKVFNDQGLIIYRVGASIAVVARGKPGKKILLHCNLLPRLGCELLPVIGLRDSPETLEDIVRMLKSHGAVEQIDVGNYVVVNNQVSAQNLKQRWVRPRDE